VLNVIFLFFFPKHDVAFFDVERSDDVDGSHQEDSFLLPTNPNFVSVSTLLDFGSGCCLKKANPSMNIIIVSKKLDYIFFFYL